jgi:hypothetical protein
MCKQTIYPTAGRQDAVLHSQWSATIPVGSNPAALTAQRAALSAGGWHSLKTLTQYKLPGLREATMFPEVLGTHVV